MTDSQSTVDYMSGFGNQFASEAIPGALPQGQNNPQKPPLGLYTEQLSGTAFTVPNQRNRRTWMYRIRPSVRHAWRFTETDNHMIRTAPCRESDPPIGQLRWNPVPYPDRPTDFLTGLHTVATNGDAHTQIGMAAHVFMATESMTDTYFYNADGELLVVPQDGGLRFMTECGILEVTPGEVAVMPRGMVYRVELMERGPGATPVRTTEPTWSCPSVARSEPTAWPTHVTSCTPWLISRTTSRPVSST